MEMLFPVPNSPPDEMVLPNAVPPPDAQFDSSSVVSVHNSSATRVSFEFVNLTSTSRYYPPGVMTTPPYLVIVPTLLTTYSPRSTTVHVSLGMFRYPRLKRLPVRLTLSYPRLLRACTVLSFTVAVRFINGNAIFFLWALGGWPFLRFVAVILRDECNGGTCLPRGVFGS